MKNNLIQRFRALGVDLVNMEIYFDNGKSPIEKELYYDVIIGPYSQKIVLSKRQEKPARIKSTRTPKPKVDTAPALTPTEKNAAAAALGRLGGLKGGAARAAKLSPERRREIAQKAAQKRWNT